MLVRPGVLISSRNPAGYEPPPLTSLADASLAGIVKGLALAFTDTFFLGATGHYGSARIKWPGQNEYHSHPFGLADYPNASKKWVCGPNGRLIESDPALMLPFEWDGSNILLGLKAPETESTNYQTYSGQIGDTSGWQGTSGAAASLNAVTGPDGTQTASELTGGASAASHWRSLTAASLSTNTSVPVSVWLKQGTSTSSILAAYNSDVNARFGQVNIAWTDGVPSTTSTAGTVSDVNYEPWPDGWYRASFVTNTGEQSTAKLLIYPDNTGNERTLYAWGAMMETGDSVSSYISTTASPVTRAEDEYRIPLSALPWNNGSGDYEVNGEAETPTVEDDHLVIVPRSGATHIQSVRWTPAA